MTEPAQGSNNKSAEHQLSILIPALGLFSCTELLCCKAFKFSSSPRMCFQPLKSRKRFCHPVHCSRNEVNVEFQCAASLTRSAQLNHKWSERHQRLVCCPSSSGSAPPDQRKEIYHGRRRPQGDADPRGTVAMSKTLQVQVDQRSARVPENHPRINVVTTQPNQPVQHNSKDSIVNQSR